MPETARKRRRRISDELEAAAREKREPRFECDEITEARELTLEQLAAASETARRSVTRVSERAIARLSGPGVHGPSPGRSDVTRSR